MTRLISFLCILFLWLGPITANAATVTGVLVKEGTSDPITHAFVQALDDNGPAGVEGHVDEYGAFSFDIAAGTYSFEAVPYIPSPDQSYVVRILGPESLGAEDVLDLGEVELSPGANIEGTISRDIDGGSWYSLNINVLDQNGQWFTWGNVDHDRAEPGDNYAPLEITYITQAVPDGTYSLQIIDQSGQFYEVVYDNIPQWTAEGNATPISVIGGTAPTDIDFHLYTNSEEHYFIKHFSPYTAYISNPSGNSTSAGAYFELGRFSGGRFVHPDEISSFVVSHPDAGQFTNSTSTLDALWRVSWSDEDSNGVIDGTEWNDPPYALTYAEELVDFNLAGHSPGVYTLDVEMENGDSLTKTVTVNGPDPALLPVNNLTANYLNDELIVNWSLPTVYPAQTTLEIKLNLFKNGEFINNQLRIKNLPPTIESFTFDEDMTSLFNTGRADQLSIEVRVNGDSVTLPRTRATYSFNAETGVLTAAPIQAIFDINGDGRTGLEETIYSLQIITNQ